MPSFAFLRTSSAEPNASSTTPPVLPRISTMILLQSSVLSISIAFLNDFEVPFLNVLMRIYPMCFDESFTSYVTPSSSTLERVSLYFLTTPPREIVNSTSLSPPPSISSAASVTLFTFLPLILRSSSPARIPDCSASLPDRTLLTTILSFSSSLRATPTPEYDVKYLRSNASYSFSVIYSAYLSSSVFSIPRATALSTSSVSCL